MKIVRNLVVRSQIGVAVPMEYVM
uniref:Uncharacterized protein n=1 Tax=Acrobeloides nanus TaxID=290746 RepID=A0A914E0L0_9BILA